MATGTWVWYRKGLFDLVNGDVAFDTDIFYMQLNQSEYTPDQDAHDFRDDLSATEAAVAGTYTAGGKILGADTIAVAAGGIVNITWPDMTWAASTIVDVQTPIIYKRVGADLTTPADDPLIAFCDLDTPISSSAGDLTIDLPADYTLRLNG